MRASSIFRVNVEEIESHRCTEKQDEPPSPSIILIPIKLLDVVQEQQDLFIPGPNLSLHRNVLLSHCIYPEGVMWTLQANWCIFDFPFLNG